MPLIFAAVVALAVVGGAGFLILGGGGLDLAATAAAELPGDLPKGFRADETLLNEYGMPTIRAFAWLDGEQLVRLVEVNGYSYNRSGPNWVSGDEGSNVYAGNGGGAFGSADFRSLLPGGGDQPVFYSSDTNHFQSPLDAIEGLAGCEYEVLKGGDDVAVALCHASPDTEFLVIAARHDKRTSVAAVNERAVEEGLFDWVFGAEMGNSIDEVIETFALPELQDESLYVDQDYVPNVRAILELDGERLIRLAHLCGLGSVREADETTPAAFEDPSGDIGLYVGSPEGSSEYSFPGFPPLTCLTLQELRDCAALGGDSPCFFYFATGLGRYASLDDLPTDYFGDDYEVLNANDNSMFALCRNAAGDEAIVFVTLVKLDETDETGLSGLVFNSEAIERGVFNDVFGADYPTSMDEFIEAVKNL